MVSKKNYSIGLDIGVGSVGWACIDENFNLLKYRGKYALGTREFSSAETAEDRRIQRGTRRRYNRRKKRIQLLQQVVEPLFAENLSFLRRIEEEEKHFWRNSNDFRKRTLSETLLSLNINPRKYPTIYHLRHDLIKSQNKFPPQLIYLALHHLVKFRGHFLNENMEWQSNDNNETIEDLLIQFVELLGEYNYPVTINSDDYSNIEKIMLSNDINRSDKVKEIVAILGTQWRQPFNLLVGLKTDISKLFFESPNIQIYLDGNLKMSFLDEDISEVYDQLTEDEQSVIDLAYQLFQNINLHELLGQSAYVSEAKVKDYNQFREDLTWLKVFYNKHYKENYRSMFITKREDFRKYREEKNDKLLSAFDQFIYEKNKYEEKFYKTIKSDIEKALKSEKNENARLKLDEILGKINRNQFLVKQKTYFNAAIPHQNNMFEAERILKNQQKYYSEISNDVIDKVKQIIRFRIPYYLGPLIKEENQSEFGWLIRKKHDVPVLPWNIDEVIDRSASAEKFIQRMTNSCMYLKNEKVLPKHSLLYEKFEVLNELNGVQIRNTLEKASRKFRLSSEEKEWIINNVFLKRKNVSNKFLIDSLLKDDQYKLLIINQDEENLKEVFGTQQEKGFSSSLSSHIDMIKIFGEINEKNFDMIEELIYWITVFEDKNIIKQKISEKYPSINKKQINQILRLNYTGWGRISKKLLNEVPTENQQTVIEQMMIEPLVFMEVLNDERFNLNERIAKLNMSNKPKSRISYQDIKELQGSPALKKSIWQAVLIVEELVDIFGEPDNIMIEFAREDGLKGRTQNRKKQIEGIQKALSKEEKHLKEFLKEELKNESIKFQNQRYFLYITQEGKCLYSGETLDINRLYEYEIDHIYPRNFVDDDSIDNLALVKSKMNQKKSGTKMPLEIIDSGQKHSRKIYWKKLNDCNLISDKKYSRLMKENFTDLDKERFFARQLVETRQITKHVRNILQERFVKTEIHTVNANIVSNMRKHSQIKKIRELNNKHHAVDAFLAALIIQFIIKTRGINFLSFDFKYQKVREKWRQNLTKFEDKFFLFKDIDEYNKFIQPETGEIINGRQYLEYINYEIGWQTTKKIGTEESAFYKQTLHSPKVKTPQYESNKIQHGVYDEMKRDSTYLISFKEVNAKGKEKLKSDFVDLFVIEKYQKKNMNKKDLAMFLASKIAKNKVTDAVIHTKIEKYQLIEVNSYPLYHISEKEKHNAKQLILPMELLKKLENTNKESEVKVLQEIFKEIGEVVLHDFNGFLPEKNQEKVKEYYKEIKNYDLFFEAITELFKTTSASAARSDKLFGYRYTKKLSPENVKIIHESITGLKNRKPKSYRHELWSL